MLRDEHLRLPHPRRLSRRHPAFAEIIRRHDEAIASGVPAYRDPVSGFSVFTAAFLLDRGTCCASGCRHCPFIGLD